MNMLQGSLPSSNFVVLCSYYSVARLYTSIWYVRNEVVHDKLAPPVQVSVRFLRSYVQSILTIAKEPEKDHLKRKSAMLDCAFSATPAATCELVNPPAGWLRPEEGRMKLNTDGSFVSADGTAGSGMILHDQNGNIVFSACRHLPLPQYFRV
ncbi:hypothetical protein VPH35_100176 [Triticum aestivum]|uniref:RNase H type-1 domain-containing protein n=1 Tax=Aegilops tauschii subsp. strangulata TaxID=200361 RepID=A0A453LYD9_AEGTS